MLIKITELHRILLYFFYNRTLIVDSVCVCYISALDAHSFEWQDSSTQP